MSSDPPPIDLNTDGAAPPPRDPPLDRRVAPPSAPDSAEANRELTQGSPIAAPGGAGVEFGAIPGSLSAGCAMEEESAGPGAAEEEPEAADSSEKAEGPVSYGFLCEERGGFTFSDLVWGKVKSHPWWPGMVFDPAYASELALKHQRKDNFLVAYFGDRTFAWCDASQLKHLWTDFLVMERQSGSESFAKALAGALAEVSRHVELGLACCCTPKDVCCRLGFQGIENSGIRGGVKIPVVGAGFGSSSFQPDKLMSYVRSLAVSPTHAVDRFGLTVARAQLMAYYRAKGFENLPDISFGTGLLEDGIGVRSSEDAPEHLTTISIGEGNLSASSSKRLSHLSRSGSRNKRKSASEDGRKLRRISDLMEDPGTGILANGAETVSSKRLKVVASCPDNSEKSQHRNIDHVEDQEVKSPSSVPYKSFKVGECIRRVASKLTSLPSVRSNGAAFQKTGEKVDEESDNPFSLDDSIPSQGEIDNSDISVPNCTSFDELLCQLRLAAGNPMSIHTFASIILGFFTGFLRFRSLNSKDASSPSDEFVYEMDQENPTSSPVSSEHMKNLEEVMHQVKKLRTSISRKDSKLSDVVKRKRGRPRLSHADDAKQPEEARRKRGRPRSRAAEDTALSEEIPCKRVHPCPNPAEEKKISDGVPRKRGRPRSKPVLDANQHEAVKLKRGRPPVRLSEGVKTPEEVKRKRGRPPSRPTNVDANPTETMVDQASGERLVCEADLSLATPAYMNDSYWTDVVICSTPEKKLPSLEKKRRGRRRKQYLIESPEYAEKHAVEATESQLPKMGMNASDQIQAPSVSANKNCSLMSERRISYFGHKCTEELNPTELILNFANMNSLPSETELLRIFSRYGPLKDAETEIQKHLCFAKVVFKRRVDAEVAFANAQKHSFFGHALLSFRLRNFSPVSECSPILAFEGQTDDNLANSVISSPSFSRNSETVGAILTHKVENAQRFEISPSCIQEIPIGRNNSDLTQYVIGAVDEEVAKEEGGKVLVDNDEIIPANSFQAADGYGDQEISGVEECRSSQKNSIGETTGQQEDEAHMADANSVDSAGQQSCGELQKEVMLEDPNSERGGIYINLDEKIIAANEDLPSSQDDFGAPISGPGSVQFCVNHETVVASEEEVRVGTGSGENSASFVEIVGFFDNVGNKEVTRGGVSNNDGSADHICSHNIEPDEPPGNSNTFVALHSTTDEALVQESLVMVQEVQTITEPADDVRLDDSYNERLEVDSNDLKIERMEIEASSDEKDMIVQDKDKLAFGCRCAEGTSLIEDRVTQTSEQSIRSEDDILVVPSLKIDGIHSGEVNDGITVGSKQLTESDRLCAEDKVNSTHGLPVSSIVQGVSDIYVGGSNLDCTSASGGMLECRNYLGTCCMKIQDSGKLHVPEGVESNVEDEIKCDITVGINTSDRKMSVDVHTTETLGNEGALKDDSCSLITGTTAEPVCEKHMGNRIDLVDAPADCIDMLSTAAGIRSISMTSECSETSNLETKIEQINEGLVGSETKMDEAIETLNSKRSEPCVCNVDVPVAIGTAEVLHPKEDEIAYTSKIKAFDHGADGMHVDMPPGDLGTLTIATGNFTTLNINSYNGGESHTVEKHLDDSVCETEVHSGSGVVYGASKTAGEDSTAANLEVPCCAGNLVHAACEHLGASVSNLDIVDIVDDIVDRSVDVTDPVTNVVEIYAVNPQSSGFEASGLEDPVKNADRIVDAINLVASCPGVDVKCKNLDILVHERSEVRIGDVIPQNTNTELIEVANDVKLEIHEKMSGIPYEGDAHLKVIAKEDASVTTRTHVTDDMHDDGVSAGVLHKRIIGTVDLSTLNIRSYNCDESHTVDQHLDASACETDMESGSSEVDVADKRADDETASANPKASNCVGSLASAVFEHVEASISNLDNIDIGTGTESKSFDITYPVTNVAESDIVIPESSNSEDNGQNFTGLLEDLAKTDKIVDAANIVASWSGADLRCCNSREVSVHERSDLHVGDVITQDSTTQPVETANDAILEIHEKMGGVPCEGGAHLEAMVREDALGGLETHATDDMHVDNAPAQGLGIRTINTIDFVTTNIHSWSDLHVGDVITQDSTTQPVETANDAILEIHEKMGGVPCEGGAHLEAMVREDALGGLETHATDDMHVDNAPAQVLGVRTINTIDFVTTNIHSYNDDESQTAVKHLDASVCETKLHCDNSVTNGSVKSADEEVISANLKVPNCIGSLVVAALDHVEVSVSSLDSIQSSDGTVVDTSFAPVTNVGEPANAINQEYSSFGGNDLACSGLEDLAKKDDRIIDDTSSRVDVKCSNTQDISVHEETDVHVSDVIHRDSNAELTEVVNDAKLETHKKSDVSCEGGGSLEAIVKEDALLGIEAEAHPETESNSVIDSTETVIDNRNVSDEHLRTLVSTNVDLDGDGFDVNKIDRSTEATHESSVAHEGDEDTNSSSCKTNKQKVPLEASCTGSGNLADNVDLEVPECENNMAVPGTDVHLEASFRKTDEHADESMEDSVRVDEMTGNLDVQGNISDLAAVADAFNSKRTLMDVELVCSMDEKTDVPRSENLGCVILRHAESSQKTPSDKMDDVVIDDGMTNSYINRNEIPETFNSDS